MPEQQQEKKIRVVCMDCGRTIEKGDPGAPESHGLCDECFPARMDEVARMKKRGAA